MVWEVTVCSRSLHKHEVRWMERHFLVLLLSPFLNAGTMLALSPSVGFCFAGARPGIGEL